MKLKNHIKPFPGTNEHTIATAINGKNLDTNKNAKGILFKKIITGNEISRVLGRICFNEKNKKWDKKMFEELLPLIRNNKKLFILHTTLHEIAHHKKYSGDYACDKWAFEQMNALGLI